MASDFIMTDGGNTNHKGTGGLTHMLGCQIRKSEVKSMSLLSFRAAVRDAKFGSLKIKSGFFGCLSSSLLQNSEQ
jgi:hypothetical protein